MANQDFRFQVRSGNGAPSASNLLDKELGFDKTNGVLYIKNNNTIQGFLPLHGGTLSGSLNLILRTSAGTGSTNQKYEPSLNWSTWGATSNKPYIGFATDQSDGTFVWSLKGTNYASGLAIGGGSGNLLWKGTKIATISDNVASATSATKDGSGNIITSTYLTKTDASNTYLKLSGGNLTGHIYLTGAQTNSSTGNTSQIIFGTSDSNHIAISSNNNALVINPNSGGTTDNNVSPAAKQIVLYLTQPSSFPYGINGNATSATKATQDGDGNTIASTYLKLSGGTLTGALQINYNGEVTGSPTLSVGPTTGAHIEIDENEIQAMTNDTTTTSIFINTNGGSASIGHADYNVNLNGSIVLSSANYGSSVPTTAGRLYFKTS